MTAEDTWLGVALYLWLGAAIFGISNHATVAGGVGILAFLCLGLSVIA